MGDIGQATAGQMRGAAGSVQPGKKRRSPQDTRERPIRLSCESLCRDEQDARRNQPQKCLARLGSTVMAAGPRLLVYTHLPFVFCLDHFGTSLLPS